MGIASRREAERWISEGRISVNGDVVRAPGTKIDPEKDKILLDRKPLQKAQPSLVYWMLNKPDRTLTSRTADKGKVTIYDLPMLRKVPFLVSPVGRLDYRTEGLLLLSNDNALVHRLSHAKYKIPRHYQALVSKRLSREDEAAIRKGIELSDGPVGKVDLKFAHGQELGASRGFWYFVTVYQGRNRIVRRIFESFDTKVIRLLRYGFGELRLPDNLAPGHYLQLNSKQIEELKMAAELG